MRRVELRDFLCHSALELRPASPGANFVSGPNGAGKSAVLQALALALGAGSGGRAAAARRGYRRLGDFVRHGCRAAALTVELHNGGGGGGGGESGGWDDDGGFLEPYRPELFGNKVSLPRSFISSSYFSFSK